MSENTSLHGEGFAVALGAKGQERGRSPLSGSKGKDNQRRLSLTSKISSTGTKRGSRSDIRETCKRRNNRTRGDTTRSICTKKRGGGGRGDTIRKHHSHARISNNKETTNIAAHDTPTTSKWQHRRTNANNVATQTHQHTNRNDSIMTREDQSARTSDKKGNDKA
jgi:hypothetical protein